MEYCFRCGNYVPEGRMICAECEKWAMEIDQKTLQDMTIKVRDRTKRKSRVLERLFKKCV